MEGWGFLNTEHGASPFTLLGVDHGGSQLQGKKTFGMSSPKLESWLCPLPVEDPTVTQHFREWVQHFSSRSRTRLCWGPDGASYKECLGGSRCLMDFSWAVSELKLLGGAFTPRPLVRYSLVQPSTLKKGSLRLREG